ncbi:MAG: aminotransferase class III-fold pyridoxal phosphate-dependent enzyme, partial [Chloroflexi bacterium]|nr:aminotransferase class III-fold pyridoxal phosphate-dependent enzyme [Chloroflexota bacterium]
MTTIRSMDEWLASVPKTITDDPLWRMKAYRLALFLGDLSWSDVTKLYADKRTQELSDQLYRAVGSVSANIAEGYSRNSGKAQAQFYEYALGSAREARNWYFLGRHILGEKVFTHRAEQLAEISRLLLAIIPAQRRNTLREEEAPYFTGNYSELPITTDDRWSLEALMTDQPTQYAIRNTQYAAIEAQFESGVVARRGETVMVGGEGCWMFDSEGNRYLDLTSSQGVAMLGYGHPALSAAITEQAQRLHACPGFFNNDSRALFLEALMGVMPGHLRHAFIANSGAEAIDGAIKFARLTTGRPGIVAAKGSFHGRTIGAVSLTWNPKYRTPFEPLLPGVSHVKYNDLAELDAAISDETAAVVLEVVQGEGGVNLGEAEFLQGAQELCRARGSLLVIDEIQTGFGRTGRWFGFQHFGLQPDIIALAKGLGAGFPMGAIVYTDRVQEALFVGAHGSTFGGNPLACAAGLAAIHAYQEEN